MTNAELNLLADQIENYFTSQVVTLDSNELEYLLLELVERFDAHLEAIRETTR